MQAAKVTTILDYCERGGSPAYWAEPFNAATSRVHRGRACRHCAHRKTAALRAVAMALFLHYLFNKIFARKTV